MGEFKCYMPLLGTTDNEQTFQYFLLKITPLSALISILPRYAFSQQSDTLVLNLHADGYLKLTQDIILPLKGYATKLPSSSESEYLYRVEFDTSLPGWSFFHKTDFEKYSAVDINQIIVGLTKDMLLIKEGVKIYIQHLIPYFSRLLQVSSQKYDEIRRIILEDTLFRIQNSIKTFGKIHDDLESREASPDEFYKILDLDLLRETCKSEIDTMLIELSIGGVGDFRKPLMEESNPHAHDAYKTYLKSIKKLEHKLYSDYNTIVFMYLLYLDRSMHPLHT